MAMNLFETPVTEPTPAPAVIRLRPYQRDATGAIEEKLAEHQATLAVLPTGTGKTIIFAKVIERVPNRCLVLAHREELIFQARDKIEKVTGEVAQIEMADRWTQEYSGEPPRVVVSSVQTQNAGRNGQKRMKRFNPWHFGLVIVDEAHHATAKSYRAVLDHYRQNKELKVLGVTATPDRLDEEALGQIFESVAYEYELLDAIHDGWLVPVRQNMVHVDGLDFSRCRTTAGDLNGADLAAVMEAERALHEVARPTYEIADGRKTLVFTVSVAQAERMAEVFNRYRAGCAERVCGKTPKEERRAMLRRYAAGEFQFLVNVGVATEGFDEPGIEVVSVARPTKSRALYCQMIGRGTRALAGVVDGYSEASARLAAIAESAKPHLTIADFAGNAGKHKLISAVDILGGKVSDHVAEIAKRISQETSGEVDVEAAIAEAQRLALEERAKRRKIIATAHYSSVEVNPFDLLGIEPARERAWHRRNLATEKQEKVLRNNGLWKDGLNVAHAGQLLDFVFKHPDQLPPTPKQAALVKRYGYDPTELSKQECSNIIDKLSKNWKRKR